MYVYIRSETNTKWTVGFYDPSGKWISESDYDNSEDAAARVHWLNGGRNDDEDDISPYEAAMIKAKMPY